MNRLSPTKIKTILFATAVFLVVSAGVPCAFAQLNLITAIQDVAKKTIPSVVHVEVTERQEVTNPLLPFQEDPFFRHFYGNPKMPKKFEREVVGLGSGIIIDAEGHIVTNSHVVGGATKITVVLSDGRRYSEDRIKVIGIDPKTDLAVLRILDGETFPYVNFGDSDKVDVGQWVVAIGHPQGLDQTVTQGIISAKHRRGIADPTSYQDFLQTDAPINPGNSGGPLLDLNGDVIGVNAAIVSGSGGFEGIGFAIPSNMALLVAKQLISTGKVERGWLGITIQDLTPELARSFGLSTTRGVLVADVMKGGPAANAGVRQGDVIMEYDGKPVENSDIFRNRVAATPVGKNAVLVVSRNGRNQDISIEVASDLEREKSLLAAVKDRFGVTVKAAGKRDMSRFKVTGKKGVVVTRVNPGGPFAKAGIEAGDIILQINGEEVKGPEDFGALLGSVPANQKIILAVLDRRSGRAGLLEMIAP